MKNIKLLGLLFFLVNLTTCCFANQEHPYCFEGDERLKNLNQYAVVAKYISTNPTVLDIGAYNGINTIALANQWKNGRIIAIEPNLAMYKELTYLTQFLPNVECYNLGFGEEEKRRVLNVCYGTHGKNPIFQGSSSFLYPLPGYEIHLQGPKVDVECYILETWCNNNGIEHLDFLNLDVEGMELEILKSSSNILRNTDVIRVAVSDIKMRQCQIEPTILFDFIESNGFSRVGYWYFKGINGYAIFVRNELV